MDHAVLTWDVRENVHSAHEAADTAACPLHFTDTSALYRGASG